MPWNKLTVSFKSRKILNFTTILKAQRRFNIKTFTIAFNISTTLIYRSIAQEMASQESRKKCWFAFRSFDFLCSCFIKSDILHRQRMSWLKMASHIVSCKKLSGFPQRSLAWGDAPQRSQAETWCTRINSFLFFAANQICGMNGVSHLDFPGSRIVRTAVHKSFFWWEYG